jgi:hypothetical protein
MKTGGWHRRVWLTSVLFIWAWPSWATDPAYTELRAMLTGMYTRPKYFANIKIEVSDQKKQTKPSRILQASIKKLNDNILKSLEHLTLISNKHGLLVIDNSNKKIVYREYTNDSKNASFITNNPFELPELSAEHSKNYRISKRQESNHSHFIIHNSSGDFPMIVYVFDKTSKLLNEVFYEVNKKNNENDGFVRIKYLWGHPKEIRASDFERSKYFVFKNGEPHPSEKYSGYEVIIQNAR